MVDYYEYKHLGYIIKLFGLASLEYGVECNYIGYVLAWDSPPNPGMFPVSCYLIGFGSGILMLVILRGGVRIIDGLLADATGENIVAAPFESLYDKARKYGCENVEIALKIIEDEDIDILRKIPIECGYHKEMVELRKKVFWGLLDDEDDDGKTEDDS